MKKVLPALVILVLAAVLARFRSPGVALENATRNYLGELSRGNAENAWSCLSDSLSRLVSPEFLGGLGGRPGPERVFLDGYDHRGIRMAGISGESTRMVWFEEKNGEYRVRGDASLDGLLGEAVLLCRAAAMSGSRICPVSAGEYILSSDSVKCPAGHLGAGISLSPHTCRARLEEVAGVVRAYLSRVDIMPHDLESVYRLSGGELGQRGGWRCPDNAYSYYALRNDSVVCNHHNQSTPVNP